MAADTVDTDEIVDDSSKEPVVITPLKDEYPQSNKDHFQDSLHSTSMQV